MCGVFQNPSRLQQNNENVVETSRQNVQLQSAKFQASFRKIP
jgi:hypothetical protein